MNIPHRIFYYNKNYNKELSGYEQEDFDLSKLRIYLENNWPHTLEIFDNYNNEYNKILLASLCILYDNGGIFINNYTDYNIDKIRELHNYNYFFSLNEHFNNIMGTFINNPIYKDMIEYMISINYDMNYTSLFEIINNYKNSNNEEVINVGSSLNKTKELSLNKKYINPIVLFNTSQFVDNFDYLYIDNKLVIIRTDSVSNWSQILHVIIYDDIICNLFITPLEI
jgi:hypothetical protein